MKKISVLFICLITTLLLISCSSDEKKVEEYIKDSRISGVVGNYVYCETDIKAEGTGVILTLTFNNLDEHKTVTREILHEYQSMLDGKFKQMLEKMKQDEPAITSLTIIFCEDDGDMISVYNYS